VNNKVKRRSSSTLSAMKQALADMRRSHVKTQVLSMSTAILAYAGKL